MTPPSSPAFFLCGVLYFLSSGGLGRREFTRFFEMAGWLENRTIRGEKAFGVEVLKTIIKRPKIERSAEAVS
jgi:hypothetical protein